MISFQIPENGRQTLTFFVFLAAQDLIAKGSLQADDLARSLVPLLLKKADRLKRGHTKRTGSQGAVSSGLLQLGWALGGILKSPELQKAFGISRQCAQEAFCPVVCDFLPQFFLAENEKLVYSAGTALGLIQKDGVRRPYMLARDEVVYARSWNLIFGMCDWAASCCIHYHQL